MRGNKKGASAQNLNKERKRVRREVKWTSVRIRIRYKDAHLSGKNGQVSDSRIRSVYYPPEKKKKKKIAHVLPKQRSKKRRDSNMRSNEK